MPTVGRVVIDGDTLAVSGLAWLDREWSTSALSDGQVGWDWFALQLDDGWEVMVYQLRLDDGTPDPLSDGVLIDPNGRRVPLEWGGDVSVEPTGTWASPVDGGRVSVRLEDPGAHAGLGPDRGTCCTRSGVEGCLPVLGRGPCASRGSGEGGRDVAGRGYVELTGYAGAGALASGSYPLDERQRLLNLFRHDPVADVVVVRRERDPGPRSVHAVPKLPWKTGSLGPAGRDPQKIGVAVAAAAPVGSSSPACTKPEKFQAACTAPRSSQRVRHAGGPTLGEST